MGEGGGAGVPGGAGGAAGAGVSAGAGRAAGAPLLRPYVCGGCINRRYVHLEGLAKHVRRHHNSIYSANCEGPGFVDGRPGFLRRR